MPLPALPARYPWVTWRSYLSRMKVSLSSMSRRLPQRRLPKLLLLLTIRKRQARCLPAWQQ